MILAGRTDRAIQLEIFQFGIPCLSSRLFIQSLYFIQFEIIMRLNELNLLWE